MALPDKSKVLGQWVNGVKKKDKFSKVVEQNVLEGLVGNVVKRCKCSRIRLIITKSVTNLPPY